ncbi:MAG: MCP four helix bundle domain-containing protein [Candidatus Coatesbacteria bacterium]|nr:MAG: MCP four helix bundle domain-containing protein [Candidatus Coatesbacteria bacterium]
MKWTIGKKLYGGFGALLLLLIILGVVGFLLLYFTNVEVEEITEATTAMEHMDELLEHSRAEVVESYSYFMTANPEDAEEGEEHCEAAKADLEALVAYARTEEAKALVNKANTLFHESAEGVDVIREEFADHPEDPDRGTKAAVKLSEHEDYFDEEVAPAFEEMHALLKADVEEAEEDIATAYATGLLVTIIVGVVAIILGVGLAFSITRGLTTRATALRNAAEEMSLGRLDAAIVAGGTDEISDLAVAFERLRTSMRAAIDRIKSR